MKLMMVALIATTVGHMFGHSRVKTNMQRIYRLLIIGLLIETDSK